MSVSDDSCDLAAMVASTELAFASNILTVDVPANDLAYSPVTGLVYAAVPDSSASDHNTLMPINPLTGALGTPIPIGFDPRHLAVSSDGNNLFAVVGGRLAVQRYNIPTATADQFFALSGGAVIEQLTAIPGRPNTVIFHEYQPSSNTDLGTVVYENAAPLPKRIEGGGNLIAVDPTDGTNGYVFQSRFSSFDHTPLLISEEGVEVNGTSSMEGVIETSLSRIEILGDRLFISNGGVYNLSLGIQVGAFPPTDSFLLDPELQKFYVLTANNSTKTIRTYSLAAPTLTQVDIDIFQIPGAVGSVLRKFASNGLAFRTDLGKVAFVNLTDGDYNKDGVVDAADYTVWRDTVGKSDIGLAADGNTNNLIDTGDYDFWLTRFGQTIGSGAVLNSESRAASVPEPTAFVGIVFLLFSLHLARQSRR